MLQRERLRQLRLERGYTHERLAEALGISAKQVWRWRYEAGESDPTSEVVTRMAKVLAVSADYLLGLTDKETPELSETSLSEQEQAVILALRHGDKLAAIRAIVGEREDSKDTTDESSITYTEYTVDLQRAKKPTESRKF